MARHCSSDPDLIAIRMAVGNEVPVVAILSLASASRCNGFPLISGQAATVVRDQEAAHRLPEISTAPRSFAFLIKNGPEQKLRARGLNDQWLPGAIGIARYR